jgi:hypothetical protein
MIAVLHAIVTGPWPGDASPDLDGFRDAVEIVVAMRRRIAAQAESADDLRRYRAACQAVERIARNRQAARIAVDPTALTALLGPIDTVYTPDSLAALVPTWRQGASGVDELDRFLSGAESQSAGLVITLQHGIAGIGLVQLPEPVAAPVSSKSKPNPDAAEAIGRLFARVPVFFTDRRRAGEAEGLRRIVAQCIRMDQPVPVSSAAHDVLTETFRELQHPSIPPTFLRLVYTDSSEGAPFPIGSLLAPPPDQSRTARLGLMSIRHMDIDAEASGYWFRNRLVSTSDRTHADTETFCYGESLKRLDEISSLGVSRLEMVHTGFEPASIGFYRAVLKHASHRPLTVAPYFYDHGAYAPGTEWVATP